MDLVKTWALSPKTCLVGSHVQHEVGNPRMRCSTRQNGGNVDYFDSIVDMDVSYDCELKFSTNFKQTSFNEVSSHDEWKEVMQEEYDAIINNGTWKLVDPPFGTKLINCKWVFKNKHKSKD